MKKYLLIADDEIDIVNTLKLSLSSNNYEIDIANSGLNIRKKIKNKKYDVLISDIDFGFGQDGIEIAEKIRKDNLDIKIIFFTAFEIENYKILELKLDAKFLKKPIDKNILIELIEND